MATRFYLHNPQHQPSGANRVEFQISGTRVNVNFAGWREASAKDIAELEKAEAQTKAFANRR